MQKDGNKLFWFSLTAVCLFGGLLMYMLYRPLYWMPFAPLSQNVPAWLHQHLPDGLWTAAFSAALIPFFRYSKARLWVWWPVVCLGAMEILQEFNIMGGTADTADFYWSLAASSTIFILLIALNKWKYSSKKQAGH